MTDEERLREVVDMIVERCKDDGQLVTVHKHYRSASEGMWYGFNLTIGAVCGISFWVLLGTLGHYLWGLV